MEVLVMNSSFENVCWIDNFESLIWTERYDSFGDFEIYIPYNSDILDLVKQDYYVYLQGSDQVMIVEEIQITSDVEDGSHIIISGRSLETLLERRIIWKQTTLSGSFQNGIKKLLNENLIAPSISARKIDGFIFKNSADSAITSLTLNCQITGENLYEVVETLCKAFNLGFRVVLNGTQMEFSLYSGVDRSYNQTENSYVVFSPNFENIVNSNYLESRKTLKNVTLVAGEDKGTARRTRTVGSASGLKRRELYTDARDIQSEKEVGEYVVTSDRSFKEDKSYYEQADCIYSVTSDTSFQSDKVYFELSSREYVITSDSTMQSGKRYYEIHGYVITSDSTMQSGKRYYEKSNGRYSVTTDSSFQSSKTYYEIASFSSRWYVVTSDSTMVSGKAYFVLSSDDRYITTTDSAFNSGTTYYELVSYYQTSDSSMKSSKTYYEYDNKIPDSEYNALLDQRGKEKLAENKETKSFEGQVEASQLFVYGKDFFKGDIVQIVNEYGIESRSRVTEFIRSQDASGLETYPTFSIVE